MDRTLPCEGRNAGSIPAESTLKVYNSPMNKEEAYKIFEVWKNHIEIFDKLTKIFSIIPESFLPFPVEVLEKALTIVTEDYFNSGNKTASKNIQETMTLHTVGLYLDTNGRKRTELEALSKMKKDLDFLFENEKIRDLKLRLLKESAESWLDLK